jgi:glycosyltransferase involved in cell wall biosynthesis
MRVTHLINGLGPGGAERSLVELLPFYRAAGVESTVVHLKDRDIGFEADARALDCELVRIPGTGMRKWVTGFRAYLKAERPDLVHTSLLEAHLVGRLASWGTGVPVLSSLVNTTYDPIRADDPHLDKRGFRLVRQADGFTARHMTTHFHAITHAVKASYEEALGLRPERITVVERGRSRTRLGVRSETRRERVRRQLGIDAGRPVLLAVGRQEFQKGHRFLIEALPPLLADHPDVLLLIAGRAGSQTKIIEQTIERLGVRDSVRLLGHRDDVTDVMAAADVFVFPSLFEGLGGSVIEAMGLGLPVVASDIPVLREVLGETGVFAAAGAPAPLAAVVGGLLRNPRRAAELGARAERRFAERFEIEGTAQRMIALYESVASSRRRVA